jgi:hypothetical protein
MLGPDLYDKDPSEAIPKPGKDAIVSKNRGVFVTHAGEIFWQPIRDNLHWRKNFVAKRPARGL